MCNLSSPMSSYMAHLLRCESSSLLHPAVVCDNAAGPHRHHEGQDGDSTAAAIAAAAHCYYHGEGGGQNNDNKSCRSSSTPQRKSTTRWNEAVPEIPSVPALPKRQPSMDYCSAEDEGDGDGHSCENGGDDDQEEAAMRRKESSIPTMPRRQVSMDCSGTDDEEEVGVNSMASPPSSPTKDVRQLLPPSSSSSSSQEQQLQQPSHVRLSSYEKRAWENIPALVSCSRWE